jgi:hypothetical protein
MAEYQEWQSGAWSSWQPALPAARYPPTAELSTSSHVDQTITMDPAQEIWHAEVSVCDQKNVGGKQLR